jgi:hypothetical protein
MPCFSPAIIVSTYNNGRTVAGILDRIGWKICEVPVNCRYFQYGDCISNFNPWLDTARSMGMHARLLVISIIHVLYRLAPASLYKRSNMIRSVNNFASGDSSEE